MLVGIGVGISVSHVCKMTLPELYLHHQVALLRRGINPDGADLDIDDVSDMEAKIKAIHHAKGHYNAYPKDD